MVDIYRYLCFFGRGPIIEGLRRHRLLKVTRILHLLLRLLYTRGVHHIASLIDLALIAVANCDVRTVYTLLSLLLLLVLLR